MQNRKHLTYAFNYFTNKEFATKT